MARKMVRKMVSDKDDGVSRTLSVDYNDNTGESRFIVTDVQERYFDGWDEAMIAFDDPR